MMLTRMRAQMLTGLAMALAVLDVTPGVAQGPDYPQIDRDEELRLALSAGPPALASQADVWLMGEHGFVKAIEGTNGFACIVVRNASLRSQLAPHCLSPAATQSVLKAFLREGELQAKGWSGESVDAELKRQWDSGELPLPGEGAFAYMLSAGQRLGRSAGRFKPHFMMYMPYVTNADIGGDPARQEFPFVGPYERHPLSTVVVVLEQFVDPDAVVLPARR